MSLIAVIKITKPKEMGELIEAKFEHCLKLADDQWLVAGQNTVMEVATKLRLAENNGEDLEVGSAIVFGLHAYYGRASDHIWDWMKVKYDAK